jgi:hypothetical protein
MKDFFWQEVTLAVGASETPAVMTKGYKLVGVFSPANVTGAQIRSKMSDTVSGTLYGTRIANGVSAAIVPAITLDASTARFYTVLNSDVYKGAAKVALVTTDAAGAGVNQATAAATFKLLFEEQ